MRFLNIQIMKIRSFGCRGSMFPVPLGTKVGFPGECFKHAEMDSYTPNSKEKVQKRCDTSAAQEHLDSIG